VPESRHREGRQALNSFTLGKLAQIHIQTLVEVADEVRAARRATSPCRAPRRKYRFDWHKKSANTISPCAAMTK
jgi:hypothetical protein